MIHVFLICLACCCSSLMPLKQSESILSEDHTQVVERKSRNNMFGAYGNCYTASDFLSYDFGQYFYDYISDFDSPRTNNLTYTHGGAKSIQYEFRSDDGPIGQLTMGGYSRNLLSWSNYSISASDYTCSLSNGVLNITSNSTSAGTGWVFGYGIYLEAGITYSIGVTTYSNNDLYMQAFFDVDGNRFYSSFTPSVSQDYIFYVRFSKNTNTGIGSGSFAFMVNQGNTLLPFEPYFSGAVQYGGITATIMKISVESIYNSQFNTYGYNYFLGFYARVPNEDRLVLGVHSMIIPNLKWLDNQSNIYNAGLFVYSSIELNPSLSDYNLHNFVWREQSEYTIKPVTTYYYNKRALALSNDESTAIYNEAYDTGYNNGNTAGYQRGYSEGVSYAQEQSSTALTIFTGIIEVGLLPVNVFLKMFEYEVFGINIAGLVSGLITIAMIMILLRFIFGGKQNGK